MKLDNTIYLISRLNTLVNKFIVSKLEEEGIEGLVPSHGSIMTALFISESLTMSELATKIEKDPSTVTTLVKKLNSLGYVSICKDKEDKRASRISLTNEGKNLEGVFKNISEEMFMKQYSNISEDERIAFRNILNIMINNFR